MFFYYTKLFYQQGGESECVHSLTPLYYSIFLIKNHPFAFQDIFPDDTTDSHLE